VLRHWTWWQVIATMLGALLAVGLILAVARISRRSVAASRTLSA
jgi:hypothetical protein